MNFGSCEFPKSVTSRSVFEEGHALTPVERIDCRGEARCLAGESCQNDMIARMRHHLGERHARITGRTAAFEHGVIARRHEAFDPSRERRRRVEER